MERLGCDGGASWGLFGASRGPVGSLWDPPGRLVGPSWRTSIKKEGRLQFRPPPFGSPKSRLSVRSWGVPGALLGALGAVLGLSRPSLGTLLGHIGTILGPLLAIGSERAAMQKSLRCLKCLKDVGLFGGSLGGALWTLRATHSVAAYMAGAAVQKKLPPLGWATGCALGRLEQNCFLQRLRHRLRARQPTIKRHPFDCAIGCALGRRQ